MQGNDPHPKKRPCSMENRKNKRPTVRAADKDRGLYDLATPLWSKYYQRIRKSIRFPRYYNKAVNW